MGMTIDEAIHDTEVMKEYLECRGEIRSEGLGVAIDTMRKYQQIEEIMHIEMNGKEALQEIERILKG